MPQIIKDKKPIILFSIILFLIIGGFCFWNLNLDKDDKGVSAAGEGWLSGWSMRAPITLSTLGKQGTILGNPTLGSTGKFGKAVTFDGSGDYISLNDSVDWDFGTGNFTIDFWANMSNTNQKSLFEQRVDDNNRFIVYYNSAYPGLVFLYQLAGTNKVYFHTLGAISTGWHHIAFIRDGSTIVTYVDGLVQTQVLDGGSYAGSMSGIEAPFVLGRTNSVADYSGLFDEFRISNTARWTAAFSSSLPVSAYTPDSNTKLLLHLDETVGSTSVYSDDEALTDYQVKVTVPYDSDMKSDFSDLRFTSSDGSTLLNHWIESYTASTSAVVWIKVPSISPGENTIYAYYGKADATSASDGTNVFAFFDDFSGTTIDSAKWDTQASPTVSGGYAVFRSANATWQSALSKYAADDARNYEIYARYKLVNYSEQRLFHGWGAVLSPVSPYPACSYRYSYYRFYSSYSSSYATFTWALETLYTTKHKLDDSYYQTVTLVENGTATNTSSAAFNSSINRVFLGLNYGGADVDWVFVKKFANPEPTFVFGEEENQPDTASLTSVSISTTDANICKIEGSETVCKSGEAIAFNSVASGSNPIKLYICKDSTCTNCGISSTSNCWAVSTTGSLSNPTATYTSTSCENVTNQYWSKVCTSTTCSDIK